MTRMDGVPPQIRYWISSREGVRSTVKELYPHYFKYFTLYMRYRSRFRTWNAYGRHHDAELDPLRLIWIDPTTVEHRLLNRREQFTYSKYVSEVKGGAWDRQSVEKLTEYDLYAAFEKRYAEGGEWEATEFFRRVVDQIEGGEPKWKCSTREEFERRCRRIDDLYETIRDHGYKTQRALLEESDDGPIRKDKRFHFAPEFGEVTVDVGRDGGILFHDGRHRFAIARVLELDRIPVRVKARHSEWQAYRDRVATTGDAERRRDHPDVTYLLP